MTKNVQFAKSLKKIRTLTTRKKKLSAQEQIDLAFVRYLLYCYDCNKIGRKPKDIDKMWNQCFNSVKDWE